MSTAAVDVDSIAGDAQTIEYRALHTGSLIALVLGILSIFVVITAANSFEACLLVTPIPVVGMSLALWSLATIRRHPDQFTGEIIAKLGLAMSVVFLIGGVAYGRYVYATELPDGYSRISFSDLKPDEIDERSGRLIPQAIAKFDGKRVFIKGYMRPSQFTHGLNDFLLVRDDQQCCFGDIASVKYYDQISVTLTNSRIDYSPKVVRIGGILEIEPKKMGMHNTTVYSLTADYSN